MKLPNRPFLPPKFVFSFGERFCIRKLIFERVCIVTEKQGLRREIDYMAEAAPSSLSAIKAELCANSLERSIVVIGVVKDKIPYLVLNTKDIEDLEDFCGNAGPLMTAHFRNPQNDLVRLAIFIPKEASNAVQRVSIPRPPSIKGDVYKTRALLKSFNDACLVFLELGVD
jgi:hypothetical protein